MPRPLSDTLVELAGAAILPAEKVGVQITGLALDLPLEIRLRRSGSGEWELLADLPQWRWQTGREGMRSRLRMQWTEGEAL
jgi:hypothetical protein